MLSHALARSKRFRAVAWYCAASMMSSDLRSRSTDEDPARQASRYCARNSRSLAWWNANQFVITCWLVSSLTEAHSSFVYGSRDSNFFPCLTSATSTIIDMRRSLRRLSKSSTHILIPSSILPRCLSGSRLPRPTQAESATKEKPTAAAIELLRGIIVKTSQPAIRLAPGPVRVENKTLHRSPDLLIGSVLVPPVKTACHVQCQETFLSRCNLKRTNTDVVELITRQQAADHMPHLMDENGDHP